MKSLTLPCAGLLLLALFSGCTSVKRFKSVQYKGEDNSLVDMALFGASLNQEGQEAMGKNLWDLSAGAQTQLIQILNERYSENDQFTSALNHEYMLDGKGPVADFTSNKLRMVFTISKKKDYTVIGDGGARFSPADRIESMKFSLEIPESYNLSFTGWNRYSTEYGEIEIADVSFSRSIDVSGDISGEYVDGSIKGASGRKEDQAVRSRFLKLNGSISPLRIEMEAEGTREIDLAGNVVADVSLAFEGFPEKVAIPLYSSEGEDSPLQIARLSFVDVLIPRIRDLPDPIMATLRMEYIYRHVESGWKTYQEWDDKVEFYSGKLSKQIALFGKDEYLPWLYCLGSDQEGSEALKIRFSSGEEHPLQFMNYRDAGKFLEWLSSVPSMQGEGDNKRQVEAGKYTLMWEGEPLRTDMISSILQLKVMPVY